MQHSAPPLSVGFQQDPYYRLQTFQHFHDKKLCFTGGGALSRLRCGKLYGHGHPRLHYSAAPVMDDATDPIPSANAITLAHAFSSASEVLPQLPFYV